MLWRKSIVHSLVFVTAATFAVLYGSSGLMADQKEKPNFIVIMTDDVGWGDLGCYGGGENRGCPTPNLDRIASQGMRFTNYYGQASCTAARASFVTGRSPIRTALSAPLTPGDPNGLQHKDPTIAEALKKLGYRTAQWGKWHLGDRPETFPTEHGFDEMRFMLPHHAGVYAYDHLPLQPDFPMKNKEFLEAWQKIDLNQWEGSAGQPPKVTKKKFGYEDLANVDDIIREDAVNYIKKHAKDEKPFFMYVCFMKVHNPNNPSPRFKGKSPGGGRYLDALMELDDNSGHIIQAVRDAGIAENTLVVWTTDNGAWADAWPDAGYTPFRGTKGTPFEGGFRVPTIAWWPGHIKAGTVANGIMSHMDWWPTLVKLAGGTPPTRIWKDNYGQDIVFDGIENSDFLLGKTPSRRDHFFYITDLTFGGLRVANFKLLFTATDTWLGPHPNMSVPALYNLWLDPGEDYNVILNGTAPARSNLRTSPGKYAGEDHRWVLEMARPFFEQFFGETAKYPNRRTILSASSMSQLINEFNASGLRRLLELLEPSQQDK